MAEVAAEVESSLAALLDRVEDGEEIVITRNGSPVARLVPNSGDIRRDAAAAANARIRARAAAARIEARTSEMNVNFDWEEIKRDHDEGRR